MSLIEIDYASDGDTLRLKDGKYVRFIGINAPETKPVPEPFGEEAKQRIRAIMKELKNNVRIETDATPVDQHGRILAHVFDASGRNIGAQLLAEGLGFWICFAPNTAHWEVYRNAELAAQAARRGVWSLANFVRSPNDVNKGGFSIVSGVVAKVQKNTGGFWIEYSENITARIAPELLQYFDEEALLALTGRTVEIRGWVAGPAVQKPGQPKKNTWTMPLTSPQMMRVLDTVVA